MTEELTQDIVYITGHRNPDSDSICSAIAYAHLKQKQGVNAYPCRLGDLNSETKYLLNRFNFPTPMLLTDARAQLDEIDMDEPLAVREETTIKEAMELMAKTKKTVLAVVNHLNQLKGIITQSNLSAVLLGNADQSIALLANTPVEYIVAAVEGKLIYAPETTHINGKVSIPAMSASRLENYELEDRIVIIGNDTMAQLQCIEKNAGLIILVWTNKVAPMVIQKAKENNCAIILSGQGVMNTSRYLFYSTPLKDIMTTELIMFNKNEFVEDVTAKMMRSRFRSYPVVDDQNHIFGFISRYHLLNASRKKLILVDHNELRQSVHGIEQAEIIEIIDHHRIGDITTNRPIQFRNEIVGSTATIITKMYNELDIAIEAGIAGLLLGALLSDTLNFKSPTTTPTDHKIAKQLADIAGVDLEQFGTELFTVANSIEDKTVEEILRYDMKEFMFNDQKVVISQFILYKLTEVYAMEEKLREGLRNFVQQKQAALGLLVFTSMHENGSIIYYEGRLQKLVPIAFPALEKDANAILESVVSRKNQIVPKLSVVFHQNNM